MMQLGEKLKMFSILCFAGRIIIRFGTAKRQFRRRISQRRSCPSNSLCWDRRLGCYVALRFPLEVACFSMALRFASHWDTRECAFIVKCSAASRWLNSLA